MAHITQLDDSILGLIPIQPKKPITEGVEWVTDIVPSYNGNEQPNWMRPAPRQSFDLKFCAQPDQVRDIFNTVYGGLVRKWAIPLWSQAQQVGTIEADADEIEVDTTFSQYAVDAPVFIMDVCNNWQFAYVTAVNEDSLELDRELDAMRRAFVMPVLVGRLLGTPTRETSGYYSNYSVSFEADDVVAYEPEAPTQFHGEDIYFTENLLPTSGKFTQNFVSNRETFDYDIGPVHEFTPWDHNRLSQPFRMVASNQEEAWALRMFLHRRGGKYRRFWYPSFEADLRLVSTGALTTVIDVALDSQIPWAQNRNNIAIKKTDGTWIARRITAKTEPVPGVARLTLESSIAMNAADVALISWLGLKRFDADKIDLSYIGNNHCEFTVSILEIEP